MITTLRTGALGLSSVQYKFDANKRLTIKLTTSSAHALYGDVNITLANVRDINLYLSDGSLSENYFNNTFKFTRTGATTLEYSQVINSGVSQTEAFATLSNNGSAITATVANSSTTLDSGTYIFKLSSVDTEFSTSQVSIVEQNINGDNGGGIERIFYESNDFSASPAQYTMDQVILTFQNSAIVSIANNNAGVTNIPLNIESL